MKKLLAFGLLLASVAARAAVFEVPISGVYTATFDPAAFPFQCPPAQATCTEQFTFSGLMEVTTPSGADGTYYDGTRVSYTLPYTGVDALTGFGALSPDDGYIQAVVLNGSLYDLHVVAGSVWTLILENGSFEFFTQVSHANARAVGTYALPGVPEPSSLALIGLGLAAGALRARRQRLVA